MAELDLDTQLQQKLASAKAKGIDTSAIMSLIGGGATSTPATSQAPSSSSTNEPDLSLDGLIKLAQGQKPSMGQKFGNALIRGLESESGKGVTTPVVGQENPELVSNLVQTLLGEYGKQSIAKKFETDDVVYAGKDAQGNPIYTKVPKGLKNADDMYQEPETGIVDRATLDQMVQEFGTERIEFDAVGPGQFKVSVKTPPKSPITQNFGGAGSVSDSISQINNPDGQQPAAPGISGNPQIQTPQVPTYTPEQIASLVQDAVAQGADPAEAQLYASQLQDESELAAMGLTAEEIEEYRALSETPTEDITDLIGSMYEPISEEDIMRRAQTNPNGFGD